MATKITSRLKTAFDFAYAEMPDSSKEPLQRMFNKMVRANESEDSIVKTLIACVYDGIAFGNWIGDIIQVKEE